MWLLLVLTRLSRSDLNSNNIIASSNVTRGDTLDSLTGQLMTFARLFFGFSEEMIKNNHLNEVDF